jgi:hypothetical protein
MKNIKIRAFFAIILLITAFILPKSAKCQTFLVHPKALDSILMANDVIHHREFTYLAFHESGFQNNNLFGMHHPYSRATYSTAKYMQVAKFEHWQDSIRDFLIWYRLMPAQEGQTFLEFLKIRNHSPCVECAKKLWYIIEKNKFGL